MIQVYADGGLVYDSRLDDLRLLGLTVTTGVNKAGTATIVMPPEHPAYNDFTSYKTEVLIYRDAVLLFRGRAFSPADNFYNQRTITCEGERCFLRDAVMRPYVYQADPAAIFADVVGIYNTQVDAFKQFVVGSVTVTDPNGYLRLESNKAEQVGDTIDKLVERCGGYIVFNYNEYGQRCINWLAELPYRSSQMIEFGENLLNFARTEGNEELATVIIPYGAEDENGNRLTIESENDGLDFIKDDEAVALRGWIAKPVYYDDVTEPINLLSKAKKDLARSKNIITALTLSAVDLSYFDKSLDSFQEGDKIRVRSKPHGVDEDFQLTEKTEDLLAVNVGSITLGKEKTSLTGADAAGDKKSANDLHRVEHNLRANYTLGIAAAIQETKQTLTSWIEQASDAIRLEVSETYATNGEVESMVSTELKQTKEAFQFSFDQLKKVVDANDESTRDEFETIKKYIRFVDGNIVLGESGNELTLKIENDRIAFLDAGAEVAYFSNKRLYVTDAHFLNSLRLGKFAWIPRENGNLSLVKVGD